MSNDVVRLIGTEGVESAGRNMVRAAQEMSSAASSMAQSAQLMQQTQKEMDFTLSNHQRFLNDWLTRLGGLLEESLPCLGEPINVRIVKDDEEEEMESRSEAPTMPAPLDHDDHDDLEGPTD